MNIYERTEVTLKINKSPLILVLLLLTAGCASSAAHKNGNEDYDRFEGYNRAMFEFNYQFDKYVLKPVAKGYRAVTNQFVRERVRSALSNLREPLSAANYLLQADPKASVTSLSRFVINSTLGLAGMFDVAEGWGLVLDRTSFNQTFAKWCVPQGPYIVLPFLGPSSPRATIGWVMEFAFDPVFWATRNDANIKDRVAYSYTVIQAVSLRESALEFMDDLESNSVDFYATVRSAYLQNQAKLRCFNDVEDEQTYDFDFGIEEEDAAFDEMDDE